MYAWVWDAVDSYALRIQKLLQYLSAIFGPAKFDVKIRNDKYLLRIPRRLTERERDEINDLRENKESDENYSMGHGANSLHETDSDRLISIPLVRPSRGGTIVIPADPPTGKDLHRISGYLYETPIYSGQRSDVFAINAHCWRVLEKVVEHDDQNTVKLAIKRLSKKTTPRQFWREYDALRAANRRYHPNIIQVLNAFRNFKAALSRSPFQDRSPKIVTELWTAMESLASAVAYLHDECEMAHMDLKPSNILLYEVASTPSLVAKISDFGLAVNLTSSRGVPGDMSVPSPDQLRNRDIWQLGAVFTELATFLILGTRGVTRFRNYITTVGDGFTSDSLSDTQFDDGVKVKDDVLGWLRSLSELDCRAREVVPLVMQMLDEEKRRCHASTITKRLQMSGLCLYSDGMRVVRITEWMFVPSPSWLDIWKQRIESRVGDGIDWWPMKNGSRSCPPSHSRIVWECCGEELSVDVPSEAADVYRMNCRPISSTSSPVSLLPRWRPSSGGAGPAQGQSGQHAAQTLNILGTMASSQSGNQNISTTQATQSNMSLPGGLLKEIYWCVDKSWTEPVETWLCSIRNAHHLNDDNVLCQYLARKYKQVRGLMSRLFSWKKCLDVEFISFNRVFDQADQIVKICEGLPNPNSSTYDYTLVLPEIVHMKIAAKQLIWCMHNPRKTVGGKTTWEMIPKNTRIPLPLTVGSQGWAMHALQRFSLSKILAWIGLLTVLGLVFVVFWLVFVSKTNLQNAFVPFTFLAIMMTMGVPIPQLLEVD